MYSMTASAFEIRCPQCLGAQFVQVPIPFGDALALVDLLACVTCRIVIWPRKSHLNR